MAVHIVRRAARRVKLGMKDVAHALRRGSADLTPPPSAVEEIGGHDFRSIGQHLADITITLGQLPPSGVIVDLGCGYGRLAVPLATHLQHGGRYRGFDVSARAIAWCNRWIAPRHPHCEFLRVDIHNEHYNRRGAVAAERFTFPYPDGYADVVFASSLFTHLQPATMRRYIHEASRVLKPGGRFVGSFFILNEESRAAVGARRGEPKLVPIDEDVAVQDPADPEAAIAFSESMVRQCLRDAGLETPQLHYGTWCERPHGLSYQDFVVASKT
jgi:SAM-dependent methyltransferase